MSTSVKSRREELRELTRLAVPIAIAQGGQALMGLVDTLVVARAGTSALAAVGLAHNLFFAISSVGLGLMMGFDPLMSQAIGAKNPDRARALLWQGAWAALGVGLVLGSLLLTLPSLLPLVGYEESTLVGTRSYLQWRAPALIPLLIFLMFRAYLQSTASLRPLVVATAVANLFNLGAGILLVFGGGVLPEGWGSLRNIPAMGADGSAVATLLSTLLEVGILGIAVRALGRPGATHSRWPKWADLSQAARVGLPIGLHLAAEVGIFSLAGAMAFRISPESMGAHQIAIAYASLSFTIAMGIGNAGSVRVGWAVGAHNTPQARRSGFTAFVGGACFMGVSGLVFALFPQQMARLAGAPTEVIPLVVPLLMVSAVFQIFDGVQGVGAGVLRGTGATRFTFVANMVAHYGVGLPVSLWLGFGMGMGVVGIWWGLSAGLICVAFSLVWRFHRLSSGVLRPLEA
ncbi:MATE family efflux transporter [Stigmatella aurantiaca]|uniref:Multidrug-efflux transporter n=2 Tax=Stigmatella aurantiaca (strain DW4/3-1) TaxID=378806 RepID=E3FY70_STIAD|nr:MATE family efflux transporter [Stigmatella aurantiaca]ADO68607.1 multidrug resistance protein NorM [Stigmatella aurantiaca DW4/3-1]